MCANLKGRSERGDLCGWKALVWQLKSHFQRVCKKWSTFWSHQIVYSILHFPDSYVLPIKAEVICRGEWGFNIYLWLGNTSTWICLWLAGEGAGWLLEDELKHLRTVSSLECWDFWWFHVPPLKLPFSMRLQVVGQVLDSVEFCRQSEEVTSTSYCMC